MGYCGSKDIPTLQETGRFVRITASGINESHPHNVTIKKNSQLLKISKRIEYIKAV
jgi:IMP dehydrogenase